MREKERRQVRENKLPFAEDLQLLGEGKGR